MKSEILLFKKVTNVFDARPFTDWWNSFLLINT